MNPDFFNNDPEAVVSDALPATAQPAKFPLPGTETATSDDELEDLAAKLIAGSRSRATLRAYFFQWKKFSFWCAARGRASLPADAETVKLYLSQLAFDGRKVPTIRQAAAAIRAVHEWKEFEPPTDADPVRRTMAGAVRKLGQPPRRKKAIRLDMLKDMVASLDLTTVRGLRNRALLCVGWAGAFRRSELAALRVEDLEETQDYAGRKAYIVTIPRSKTDPKGQGLMKALFPASRPENIDVDPVRALDSYLAATGITTGPIFRSAWGAGAALQEPVAIHSDTVTDVICACAKRAGLSGDFAGHSLRRGFITEALLRGAGERSVMNQSGHRSLAAMRQYEERTSVLIDNAASRLI